LNKKGEKKNIKDEALVHGVFLIGQELRFFLSKITYPKIPLNYNYISKKIEPIF
jgi:hypothetical protein